MLLTAPGIDVNEKNRYGWAPLSSAVSEGFTDCVRELLKAKAIKVNQRVPYQLLTPLMLAIEYKHEACAKLLIQDPRTGVNNVSEFLQTALSKAREYGLTETVSLLETHPNLNKFIDRVIRFLRH